MSLYDINYNDRMTELTPPKRRKPRMLAWIYCIVYPLQWIRDRFLGDYKTGAVYPLYNAFATYNELDRVINYDKSVYECLVNGTVSGVLGPSADPAWMKIQDLFIGVDERVKYNSQIIVLEYALNHYYFVPTTDPQIYIENNTSVTNAFLMGQTGPTSSNLVNNSLNATGFMGNVPALGGAYAFTVWVPTSLLATLGLTLQDQINNVRQFVDKYKLGGLTYTVDQF